MNVIKRSEAIRSGLQRGFQDGTSKLTCRKCFGYDVGPDGELIVNSYEAAIVRWIFDQYLTDSSLGAIAADLERRDILSPTGRSKWNRETLNKLLSNEKYTGRCCSRKASAQAAYKSKMMASWIGISVPAFMRPLFLTRYFLRCSGRSLAASKIRKTWLL